MSRRSGPEYADRADLNSPHGSEHAPRDRKNSFERGAPSSEERAAKPGLKGANPIRTAGIKQRPVTGGMKPGKKAKTIATGGLNTNSFNTDKWL